MKYDGVWGVYVKMSNMKRNNKYLLMKIDHNNNNTVKKFLSKTWERDEREVET